MKLQVTAIAAAIIMFAACTKTQTANEELNNVSNEKIEALISTVDFQSRIQLFNLLTKKEKYKLWRDHMVKAKNQFLNENSPAKAAKVDEILTNLTVDVFENSSNAAAVFSNYFIPRWQATMNVDFTPKEMYDLGFNPGVEVLGRVAPEEIGTGGGGGANCFCHAGASGFSCRRITVEIPMGISIVNGICEQSAIQCVYSRYGCGWFWLSSCNGNHCNF
jgi:hypothetical protein